MTAFNRLSHNARTIGRLSLTLVKAVAVSIVLAVLVLPLELLLAVTIKQPAH